MSHTIDLTSAGDSFSSFSLLRLPSEPLLRADPVERGVLEGPMVIFRERGTGGVEGCEACSVREAVWNMLPAAIPTPNAPARP